MDGIRELDLNEVEQVSGGSAAERASLIKLRDRSPPPVDEIVVVGTRQVGSWTGTVYFAYTSSNTGYTVPVVSEPIGVGPNGDVVWRRNQLQMIPPHYRPAGPYQPGGYSDQP